MLPLYSDPSGGAILAAYAAIIVFGVIFGLIFYVVGSFFLMKLFEKAGVEGKWRAWVPVYNTLIFAKLGDLNPLWLLALWGASIVLGWIPVIGNLFPIAAGVYMVLAAYRIGLKLQKEVVWVILYVFLSLVWLGIVAFDKSRWNTAIAPAPWANTFLRDTTTWAGIPAQVPAGGYAAAPGAYGQPGYPAAPPAGYGGPVPPPAGGVPPQGYAAPPAGYTPPTAPPAGPPAPPAGPPAPPAGYTPPPSADAPPAAAPPTTEPPAPEAPKV